MKEALQVVYMLKHGFVQPHGRDHLITVIRYA